MNRKSSHFAFTLIELLVVLSIIALLVSILLPALGKSRKVARAAVCMSSQRQTTLALLAYTNDADGRFVPNRYHEPDNTVADAVWWFGREAGGAGSSATSNRPLDKTRSPLADYFGGDIIEGLECPEFPATDPRFFAKFSARSAHFGYNEGLAPQWHKHRAPRGVFEVKTPSEVLAFADAIHIDGLNKIDGKDAFYEPHYIYHSYGELFNPRLGGFAHARHDDKANVAFVDGHVTPQGIVYDVATNIIAGATYGNLDTSFGESSLYGFDTRVLP
jgi:prepilin-type processing-associated H-X9-DG protein/prepilin-type N-terminal cleavage/methylation domain-containing protein